MTKPTFDDLLALATALHEALPPRPVKSYSRELRPWGAEHPAEWAQQFLTPLGIENGTLAYDLAFLIYKPASQTYQNDLRRTLEMINEADI